MSSLDLLYALARFQFQFLRVFGLLISSCVLNDCASVADAAGEDFKDTVAHTAQSEEQHMWMSVGERRFAITLADTEAARAFVTLLPLTLKMAELNGNEKHADLAKPLPTAANRPGTIHAGDLLLYGSNTVVVFYKTFRSSYSYTRIGQLDDPAALEQVLGQSSVTIVFSKT